MLQKLSTFFPLEVIYMGDVTMQYPVLKICKMYVNITTREKKKNQRKFPKAGWIYSKIRSYHLYSLKQHICKVASGNWMSFFFCSSKGKWLDIYIIPICPRLEFLEFFRGNRHKYWFLLYRKKYMEKRNSVLCALILLEGFPSRSDT